MSVVVVNYNYGRYLTDAVGSVFGQTYPNVECIVVDNASTDESDGVLTTLSGRFPALKTLRRDANDGQSAASVDGLAESSGQYVIFLDADDLLLPNCVEAHIYVHLSLRRHIGFTSGDMLQVVRDQVVVSTSEDFNRYIRSGKGRADAEIRPFLGLPDDPARFARVADRLNTKVYLTRPLSTRWVWSATSGNCYRRDALTLFADNPSLTTLRTGTDMYFALSIGALCGSALIDEPVFAYRVHGGNIYTQRAQLDRTLAFRPGSSGDSNERARLAILDHLVATAVQFAPNMLLKLNLILLLITFDRPDRDPALPLWQRRSRLARRLTERRAEFERDIGHPLTLLLALLSGAPLRRR